MIEQLLQTIVRRTLELNEEYFSTHYFHVDEDSKIEYIASKLRDEL